jgi:hypothetical protein
VGPFDHTTSDPSGDGMLIGGIRGRVDWPVNDRITELTLAGALD